MTTRSDLDIPIPPHSLVVACNKHSLRALGIVVNRFDARGQALPDTLPIGSPSIESYGLWDGIYYREANIGLLMFEWHMMGDRECTTEAHQRNRSQ